MMDGDKDGDEDEDEDEKVVVGRKGGRAWRVCCAGILGRLG